MENRDHSIKPIRLEADGLSKRFHRRIIFENVSFVLQAPASLAITGRNGSGKSTLVKILAGVLGPSAGSVRVQQNGNEILAEDFRNHLGFVAPYLVLYDELSPVENLRSLSAIRSGVSAPEGEIAEALQRVGLESRKEDYLRTFSSGMLQRVKYALAILHRPSVLILDEPTANLDDEGTAIVRKIAQEQRSRGILIVATNETAESQWCQRVLEVGRG